MKIISLIILFLFSTQDDNSTTFYYQVTSPSEPAISHIVYPLCPAAEVLDGGVFDPLTLEKESTDYSVGQDPLSIFGIKFEDEFEDGETKYYYFTLSGIWDGADGYVAIKRGTIVEYVNTTVPDLSQNCSPTAITLESFNVNSGVHVRSILSLLVALVMLGVSIFLLKRGRP